MPLPSLEKIIPQFDITIPSSGEKLKFRPFLVKEEKLLLLALESGEETVMLDAIVQVVQACAISPLRVDTLATFDMEYIFLQLRARSVSEVVELAYKCHNERVLTPAEVEHRSRGRRTTDDGEVTGSCDNVVKISVNLDTVNVITNPAHQPTIFLTETMGINMRYPNFKMQKQMMAKSGDSAVTDALKSIALCIESVFDENSVYTNFQLKEIEEWIEKLTQPQFTKLQAFFETMPKLAHDVEFLCQSCGYQETIHIEGLQSFFG